MPESGTERFRDPRLSVAARVADLVARLTPEEKAGQLTSLPLPPDGRLDARELRTAPGIVIAPADHWRDVADRVRALQAQLSEVGPWGIPALVVAVRNFTGAVRFPPMIARAAAWDQDLMAQIAAASALEARAGGAAARLGPMLALAHGPVRTPPGDRDQSLGGDPVLASELVAAHVRGSQGTITGRVRRDGGAVVATHLGAMAWQLSGRSSVDPHERLMRDVLLATGEAAVQAGALIVVPPPTANGGVPAHTDSWLLRHVLRREWGFDGAVLAAPGALGALVDEFRVTADLDAAIALALEAGVDVVGMDGVGVADNLIRLLRRGALPSWLLDDAVSAVLRLKMTLRLFENPGPLEPAGRVDGPDHRALARRATVESAVLLADPDRVLPLTGTSAVDVLGIVTPGADTPGAGCAALGASHSGTLAAALATALPGCGVRDRGTEVGAPDLASTVVAVVAGDPAAAVTMVSRIVATGRRCVALVCSGDLDGAPELVSTRAAVLVCWQPPAEQADAVADVLAGHVEPGGRLPFPIDDRVLPLGHGGGYTSFGYSQLQVLPARTEGAEPVVVQFRLTNTGNRDGKEVVQVYLLDRVSSVLRRQQQLVGFAVVRLDAGRHRQVRIRVPPSRLAVWDRSMRRVVEPGEFDVLVGRSATDIRLTGSFTAGTGGDAALLHPRRC